MVKKLLAMGCIAAMLLAPVRAQVFEVYSGEKTTSADRSVRLISRAWLRRRKRRSRWTFAFPTCPSRR